MLSYAQSWGEGVACREYNLAGPRSQCGFWVPAAGGRATPLCQLPPELAEGLRRVYRNLKGFGGGRARGRTPETVALERQQADRARDTVPNAEFVVAATNDEDRLRWGQMELVGTDITNSSVINVDTAGV